MTQVIVHAGFHKTGTTSLQDFMEQNRKALGPYLQYYGKSDFFDAGAHARIYAQRPFPWRLWRFRRSFRTFLSTLEPGGTIVLSRETFSGGMPGHRRLGGGRMLSYLRPATAIARVIIAELRQSFGPDVKNTFFYTTRDRDTWIASIHGHLLRSIALTEDYATFAGRFPRQTSPDAEAAQMAKVLAPIPVVTATLEDFAGHPEGPAAALLDILKIPPEVRGFLRPAPRSNSGQSEAIRQDLLALNRKGLRKRELKRQKSELLASLTRAT